jgi:steroid 5-alpha reductase family enzyme
MARRELNRPFRRFLAWAVTVWLSFFLVAAPLNGGYGLMSFGSPLLMFVLLRFVSGVVINDAVQAKKPKYARYIATTPAFFPWCRSESQLNVSE